MKLLGAFGFVEMYLYLYVFLESEVCHRGLSYRHPGVFMFDRTIVRIYTLRVQVPNYKVSTQNQKYDS